MKSVIKRLVDIIGALLGLVLLSPVLVAVAAGIRFTMGSPVLFRQPRPGLHGKPFTLLKFRTMSDARASHGNPLPDAERLTPFGRFLRSTSLDELPELLNVLRGQMSLVGPRPLLLRYAPYFTAEERQRFRVRPGITGLAQVTGRNNLSWDDRLGLDIDYVAGYSLLLDLKLLAITLWQVVRRKGVQVDPGATMRDLDAERASASPRGGRRATILPARTEDAPSIHDLLTDSFEQRLLQYTIYHSRASVAYLERQFTAPEEGRAFFVMWRRGRPIGYYASSRRDVCHFLDYIAVDRGARRQGVGDDMLAHFEFMSSCTGATRLALDVFESNQIACNWYGRCGYREVASWYQVCLDLRSVRTSTGQAAVCEPVELHRALAGEADEGVARVHCLFGGHPVTIGLMGGNTLRLVATDVHGIEDVMGSLAGSFAANRETLIVSGLEAVPDAWPIRDVLRVVRLVKERQ